MINLCLVQACQRLCSLISPCPHFTDGLPAAIGSIASWAAEQDLPNVRSPAGAGRVADHLRVVLERDVPASEGNIAFDQSLRTQNLAWGIRCLEDVAQVAAQAGLQLHARHPMLANNLLLIWRTAEQLL